MTCFEAHIDNFAVDFLRSKLFHITSFETANTLLNDICGINQFFNTDEELIDLKQKLQETESESAILDRRAYGDFQTNQELANRVVKYIAEKEAKPQFVLEPTCGKGSFVIASLQQFKNLIKLVGIEVYLPYVWETKFKILSFYLQNEAISKPAIEILHANIFSFSFQQLATQTKDWQTLVIGNPPWVTNAELGAMDSKNLPKKSNFKKHNGIDAITGKGNFDIGEYISLLLLNAFHKHNGQFAFLIKNTVVKNLLYEQKSNSFHIEGIEKLNIDSKKEFEVSVDACLFLCQLNQNPAFICQEMDLYNLQKLNTFGWYKDKFVYSIADYKAASEIDGISQFVWRQGIKHDCTKIMEMERCNGHYINKLKQEVKLEKDLIYGLLKSSDLKNKEQTSYRKITIVTQKKIGQDTQYIQRNFPLTYAYLKENKAHFDKRKSIIYKGKPPFSIFGVGDYSFAPYKVAISGMYKTTHFTLVLPDDDKPIMLDDTCYFIGFEDLVNARIAHFLLNSPFVQQFLKSIIFSDSKRAITKQVLMRIDFQKLYNLFSFNEVRFSLENIEEGEWKKFERLMGTELSSQQMTLF